MEIGGAYRSDKRPYVHSAELADRSQPPDQSIRSRLKFNSRGEDDLNQAIRRTDRTPAYIGSLLWLTLWLPAAALAGPSLVTTASGKVEIFTSDKPKAAPTAPFAVQANQSLRLAAGATVLVLSQGSAQQIMGPAVVEISSLAGASAAKTSQQSTIARLLEKKTYTGRVGATRGGTGTGLLRPVPDSTLVQLRSIQWHSGNGPMTVEIHEMMTLFESIWSGTGTGSAVYDGHPLRPGEYAVLLDGKYLPFVVASAEEQAEITEAITEVSAYAVALEKSGVTDGAALLSLPAALYLQAGMPTEALYLVDAALKQKPQDPGLLKLRGSLEKRSGLQRP